MYLIILRVLQSVVASIDMLLYRHQGLDHSSFYHLIPHSCFDIRFEIYQDWQKAAVVIAADESDSDWRVVVGIGTGKDIEMDMDGMDTAAVAAVGNAMRWKALDSLD